MITDNLPPWIGLLITLGTGIFFWGAFYLSTRKTQETVEELRTDNKEFKNMMHGLEKSMSNMDKNIALFAQKQEYIQENILLLKDRVKELEGKVA